MIDKNSETARKIIDNGKIKSVKDLQTIISYWYKNGNSDSDILNAVNEMEFCWQIKTVSPEEIAKIIIRDCNLEEYKFTIKNIVIYKKEMEDLMNIDDENVRKLMYCFLIYSKINNHSSGWIRYDKNYIFHLGNFSNATGNKYVSDCCKYGLELRVIGAKHSLVCFHLGIKRIDGDVLYEIKNLDEVIEKYERYIKGDFLIE